jgi:hypothetical protein
MEAVVPQALVPMSFVRWLGWIAGPRRIVDDRPVGDLTALAMDVARPASLSVANAAAARALIA